MIEFIKKLWSGNRSTQVVICTLDDATLQTIARIDQRTQFIDNVVQGNSQGIASILKKVNDMSVDITQLDAEIKLEASDLAAASTQLAALAAQDQKSFSDLVAKIASNPTAPAADFTAEFNALEANRATIAATSAAIAAALAAAQKADPGTQAVPPGPSA